MKLQERPGPTAGSTTLPVPGFGLSTPSILCCHKCRMPITEPHFLVADKRYWHEDCLRCTCCDARLAELDKFCYVKANMALCKRDYLRMYGATGFCSVCQQNIQAFEYVMRAKNNVYHLDCFSCQRCHLRFCVGDKYYLHDNKILCEHDYEEATTAVPQPSHAPFWCQVDEVGSSLPIPPAPGSTSFMLPLRKLSAVGQATGTGFPPVPPSRSAALTGSSQLSSHKLDDASSGYGSPSPTTAVL